MTQRGRALQRVAVAAALTVAAGLVALLTATAPFQYLALKAYDTYLSRLPLCWPAMGRSMSGVIKGELPVRTSASRQGRESYNRTLASRK